MKNQAKTSVFPLFALLLASTFLFNQQAKSQVRLFLSGGPQFSTVEASGQNAVYDTEQSPFLTGRTAARIGILADIPFKTTSRWSLQPGIFFSGKGQIFEKTYDTTNNQSPFYQKKITDKSDYIDIPLSIAYKIPLSKKTSFFLSAGPMLSIYYGSKTLEETSTYINDPDGGYTELATTERKGETGKDPGKFKSAYAGVAASAGIDFGGVLLKGDFTRGLTDFHTPSVPGSFYHQTIGGTLSFRIARQKEAAPHTPKIKDSDNDGIPDQEDACPNEAGSAVHNGCPDRDGDGVPDKDDQCPDKAGLQKYKGCPVPDTDGDGIYDEDDQCPTTPGVARFKGCPIPDRDGDGVNDEEDTCPDQPGTKENKGCPVVKEEIIQKAAQIAAAIQFEFGKTTIHQKYHPVLDEIAALLAADQNLKLSVEGHTDNKGSAERNKLVSQQRADAIRNYLLKKGLDPAHVTAVGFGSEQPVSNNDTEAGRALNRRVVFKLNY